MQPATQEMYSQITGSIPVRTDVDLSGRRLVPTASADCGAASERRYRQAIACVLSLAHNMAQPNGITAAMIDVLTEYVHNNTIPPPKGRSGWSTRSTSAQ